MWAKEGGREAKEEHEAETTTTRKLSISNFFFTFCTHMKPHHFQDNLCLSIAFIFHALGFLCVMFCACFFAFVNDRKKHTRTSELKGNNLSFSKSKKHLWLLPNFLSPVLSVMFCFLVLKDNQRNTQKTIGYPCEFIYCIRIKYQVNGVLRASK
jgi:hypothetical protein